MPAERRASSRPGHGARTARIPAVSFPEPPNLPPPQPRSLPLPPPPLPGSAATPAAPAGYVPYQQAGLQRAVKGLGTAVLVMYGLVTGFAVLLAGALYHRASVVEEVLDVSQPGTSLDQRVIDADNLVITSSWVVIGGVVVAAVVTAVWARRIATNAKARGAYDVRPGMATGGWFIPIASWWLGFREVQKAVASTGTPEDEVRHWQRAWIITSLLGIFVRNGINDFETSSADAFVSSLQRQWMLGAASAALYAISLWFAIRAVRTASAALDPA